MKKIILACMGLGVLGLLLFSKKSSAQEQGETGTASWYGPGFDGKQTASGEIFDQDGLTAAHRTMQLGTMVTVTNLDNGLQVIVKVNDRGPYAKNADGSFARIIDLSKGAADALGFLEKGLARVSVQPA